MKSVLLTGYLQASPLRDLSTVKVDAVTTRIRNCQLNNLESEYIRPKTVEVASLLLLCLEVWSTKQRSEESSARKLDSARRGWGPNVGCTCSPHARPQACLTQIAMSPKRSVTQALTHQVSK
jgi:hypothetical protein